MSLAGLYFLCRVPEGNARLVHIYALALAIKQIRNYPTLQGVYFIIICRGQEALISFVPNIKGSWLICSLASAGVNHC